MAQARRGPERSWTGRTGSRGRLEPPEGSADGAGNDGPACPAEIEVPELTRRRTSRAARGIVAPAVERPRPVDPRTRIGDAPFPGPLYLVPRRCRRGPSPSGAAGGRSGLGRRGGPGG